MRLDHYPGTYNVQISWLVRKALLGQGCFFVVLLKKNIFDLGMNPYHWDIHKVLVVCHYGQDSF